MKFMISVLVIHHDDHFALADILNGFFDFAEGHASTSMMVYPVKGAENPRPTPSGGEPMYLA
jgi:hypothetical protein